MERQEVFVNKSMRTYVGLSVKKGMMESLSAKGDTILDTSVSNFVRINI